MIRRLKDDKDAEISDSENMPLQNESQETQFIKSSDEIKTSDKNPDISDLNGYFDESGNFIPAGTIKIKNESDNTIEEQENTSEKITKKAKEKKLRSFF